MLQSINPATGEVIKNYTFHSVHEAGARIEKCHIAFGVWRACGVEERIICITRLGELLAERKQELAMLVTSEMGKLLRESVSEIEKCALACEFYAKNGEAMLADQPVKTQFSKSYVSYQPLGVVLAIMPWNFPFWQAIRAAVPALLVGNGIALKHASNTPGCAEALEQLFKDAGFPPHLYTNIFLKGAEAQRLIAHPLVKAVTLTGSTPAGRAVAAEAGAHIKKCVLELGGNDPYVILADADVEQAAKICAEARLLNAGQSCISAKRFIVAEEVYMPFKQLIVKAFNARTMGNPSLPETSLQPLARQDLRDQVHQQVKQSLHEGAELLAGGVLPEGAGAFYPATVLGNVRPGMCAFEEEIFGPVASLISARDETHAIALANLTPYGLGAALFTSNIQKGERLAREHLQAGSVFINESVRSDPALPFGGINKSGYGRELSRFGLSELVNVKTVVV